MGIEEFSFIYSAFLKHKKIKINNAALFSEIICVIKRLLFHGNARLKSPYSLFINQWLKK